MNRNVIKSALVNREIVFEGTKFTFEVYATGHPTKQRVKVIAQELGEYTKHQIMDFEYYADNKKYAAYMVEHILMGLLTPKRFTAKKLMHHIRMFDGTWVSRPNGVSHHRVDNG